MLVTRPRNALLLSLPPDELERLAPYLEPAPLVSGRRTCSIGETLTHLWFPESGAIARLFPLPTGETVEAGIIGYQGVCGMPLALGGYGGLGHCTVQISGTAYVMGAAEFEQHVRAERSPLLTALNLYASLYMMVLGQLTACHCLHRIEQRLGRCLLTLHDYADDDDLRITHDTLSDFLGVHRPSITYALADLAGAGAIALERRRIHVTDRPLLESRACECYAAIKAGTERELDRIGSVTLT